MPDKKQVQVPAAGGGSKYVKKSSAAGKRYKKAGEALDRKKRGKKLLHSEVLAIRKSYNPTKLRKKKQ